MSLIDKLISMQALLCLFGERYIHVDDEQALHDCKYRRDELVSAYAAIMAILNDHISREEHTTRECA